MPAEGAIVFRPGFYLDGRLDPFLVPDLDGFFPADVAVFAVVLAVDIARLDLGSPCGILAAFFAGFYRGLVVQVGPWGGGVTLDAAQLCGLGAFQIFRQGAEAGIVERSAALGVYRGYFRVDVPILAVIVRCPELKEGTDRKSVGVGAAEFVIVQTVVRGHQLLGRIGI